jgi:formylglycine-generating enzyme required for sulfatase activity
MALIPAGSFEMGNALSASGDGSGDELPLHPVYVSAFYMDKYEVTKELWDEVRAWGLNNGYTDLDVGNGVDASKGANHPVHSITWYAMVKWCNARSRKDGLTECYTVGGAIYKTGQSAPVLNMSASGYRLPTEAEWEKAARGNLSGKRFPWGDTISRSQANYIGSTSSYSYDLGPYGSNPTYATGNNPYTSPVGSFAANGYGLYDMAGNMWEWCWDWYGAYASETVSDPTGPASGSDPVLRGGHWADNAGLCRVSIRSCFRNPANSGILIGFRCVRR